MERSAQLQRRAFLGAFPLLVLAPVTLKASTAPEVLRIERTLMGTRIRVVVQGPGRANELLPAAEAAFTEMRRLEALFTRYRNTGPLQTLRHAAGSHPVSVPPELLWLLRQAGAVSQRTNGDFDITVGAYSGWDFNPTRTPRLPTRNELERQSGLVNWRDVEIDERDGLVRLRRAGMRVDLGGIAKLPILEAGMQVLARHGLHDALIDGGGDVRASGRIQGRAWSVGVRDPMIPSRLLGLIELEDGWVASSGDYERAFASGGRRYHHILDPRTGMPTQGTRGVTLVSRTLQPLHGLGAALMVGGHTAAMRWLPELLDVEVLIVGKDGLHWSTPGFPNRLRPI